MAADAILMAAVEVANRALGMGPSEIDLLQAREALVADDVAVTSDWALIIIGYVEVRRMQARADDRADRLIRAHAEREYSCPLHRAAMLGDPQDLGCDTER